MDDRLGTTIHASTLVAVTGVLAWLSGRPMLFPSLGPSAFVLATWPESEASSARRVVGGHAVGVVTGLLAYHLLASGLVMTAAPDPGSVDGLRLAASGVLATAGTVGGMLAARTRHPPACATTLIISLGLLSSAVEGGLVMLSVTVLVVADRALLSGAAAVDRYREDAPASGR